ncbi:MAG: ATP-binding cassette domain-containing protein [Ilumatobacteraceae bacterium]
MPDAADHVTSQITRPGEARVDPDANRPAKDASGAHGAPDRLDLADHDADGVMVEAIGLGQRFGANDAVVDVDLSIPGGVIVGLIGPSGCGKTTLVRMLTGILEPTSGTAEVFGVEPSAFGHLTRASGSATCRNCPSCSQT